MSDRPSEYLEQEAVAAMAEQETVDSNPHFQPERPVLPEEAADRARMAVE